jgi:hypothetical protein
MSTGKLTGMLVTAMMIAPVLVWGQIKKKTDSLSKALAAPKRNTGKLILLYRNNDLYADQSNHLIEIEVNIEEKTCGRFMGQRLYISGRFLSGNKNSFKL